ELPHSRRREPDHIRPERLLGALAVHRQGAAGAAFREGTDRLRSPTRGDRAAWAVAGHGPGTPERAQGAPTRRGCAAAAGAVGGAVRRTGPAGPSVPGGLAAGAAVRQGPGAAGAGVVGDLHAVRPDRRLGAGGA